MVFDDPFAAAAEKKWGSKPRRQRPSFWHVATADDRDEQRVWINGATAALPEPGRSKMMRHLRDDRRFLGVYSELAVAAILQSAGMVPEYEPNLGGGTPDFYVPLVGGRPLIVEAHTRFRADEVRREALRWEELRDRVAEIGAPFGVGLERSGDRSRPPSSGAAKQIARQLRRWLLLSSTRVGDVTDAAGYRFRVVGEVVGVRAQFLAPLGGGWIDSNAVADVIREKLSKYKRVADELDAVLLIVLAAESLAPLDLAMIDSALAGRLMTSVSLDVFDPGGSTSHTVKLHAADTPAALDPALSGAGYLRADTSAPGVLTVTRYANATRKVTELASGWIQLR